MDGGEITDSIVKGIAGGTASETVKAALSSIFGKKPEQVEQVERELRSGGSNGLQPMVQTLLGAFRVELAARALARYRRVLDDLGIPERELPPKLFLPMLEEASGESDDYLHDKWARLMASATRSDADKRPMRLYIEKLKQLDPIEARLLDLLYERRVWFQGGGTARPDVQELCALLGVAKNVLLSIAEHVRVLGLTSKSSDIVLSPLGIDFVAACRAEPVTEE